jgi:hypothetical protein
LMWCRTEMVNLIRCLQCLQYLQWVQREAFNRKRPIHGFGDRLNLQSLPFVPMLSALSDWFLISASSQCQASRSFWYSFFVDWVINQSKAGRSFACSEFAVNPSQFSVLTDGRTVAFHLICPAPFPEGGIPSSVAPGNQRAKMTWSPWTDTSRANDMVSWITVLPIVAHSVLVTNGFILPSDFYFDHVHWAELSFPVQVCFQFSSHLLGCCPNLWSGHWCNQHLFKSCSRMNGQVMVSSVSFLRGSESNSGNICGWLARPRCSHWFIQSWIHWAYGRTRLTKRCADQRR